MNNKYGRGYKSVYLVFLLLVGMVFMTACTSDKDEVSRLELENRQLRNEIESTSHSLNNRGRNIYNMRERNNSMNRRSRHNQNYRHNNMHNRQEHHRRMDYRNYGTCCRYY